MKISFNEVSFRPYPDSSVALAQKFNVLLRTYRKLKEQYGVKHVIFPTKIYETNVLQNQTFAEWINTLNNTTLKSQILSIIKKPFSDETQAELTEENALFSFENIDIGIEETTCIGLELAYYCETAAVSIETNPFWHGSVLPIYSINCETEKRKSIDIRNCCLEELPAETEKWFLDNKEVDLIRTDIQPADKQISLRDDHGKDVLLMFAKKIVYVEHVCSVINSLPFNKHDSRFIKRCYPDGKIELVLYWDDRGIGMVVQTTGRNLRETEAIAEKLRDKFDK